MDGALMVTIRAFFQLPKSWSKKKTIAALAGDIRPTGRPDLDNIAKLSLDALNGIAYRDDAQVVALNVSKAYTDKTPTTMIMIEALT